MISQPLIRERLAGVLPLKKRDAVREAFIERFKQRDFDGGLENGVRAIEKALDGVRVEAQHRAGRAGVPRRRARVAVAARWGRG